MKTTSLLFSLLFLIALRTSAQDRTMDSLKIALKNAKHDTTRCNILNVLSETAPDGEWEKYNGELKSLSETCLQKYKSNILLSKVFKKYCAASLNNIGLIYGTQGNIPKALEYYTKSLKMFEEISDKKGMATSINNIGFTYYNQDNIPKALEHYTKSLKILEEIGDKKGMATSINNIGLTYYDQGDIPKALEYYTKNLKLQEEMGDKAGIATSLVNIGAIYGDLGNDTKALEYLIKSLKIKEEIGDKAGIAYSLNNIGTIFKNQGDIPKALEYMTKCLKIQEEVGHKEGIAVSLNNIGFIYYKQGNIPKTLECYTKSLKIHEEIGDKAGIATSLLNIGFSYNKQGNSRKALEYTTKSMALSKELGYPENIKNAANSLKDLYRGTGNYKLSLQNYELYIQMRDSIDNEETHKASIKSQFKYEYEKKAAADSVKVAEEKKVVEVQLKQEKTQRFALYGGLALVLVFAGFMFNRFRVTQKQKNIIELKEKETQQQNKIITIQKHLVEEKHKEITDSINYAERIQRSFLATKELLDANLQEYFILFKPKDVVSGDFYWAGKLNNGFFALVIADSTGHGVPGAIMSLLNVTSLEKAIEHHTNPADILNHTRETIIERLKKDGSPDGGKDGMDCSLLAFDFSNKQLHIAAANNPVWIIRNNELIEIKPDKMPVGKSERQNETFTLHTLQLQKGDTIYTLTDGFPDQFGGPKGKKFMSKNLKELLLSNVHLPIPQQKELLESTFKNWVGDLEQVDDVCIVGIKI